MCVAHFAVIFQDVIDLVDIRLVGDIAVITRRVGVVLQHDAVGRNFAKKVDCTADAIAFGLVSEIHAIKRVARPVAEEEIILVATMGLGDSLAQDWEQLMMAAAFEPDDMNEQRCLA